MSKIKRISVATFRLVHDYSSKEDEFTTDQWHDLINSLNKYLKWDKDKTIVEIKDVGYKGTGYFTVWSETTGEIFMTGYKYRKGHSNYYRVTDWCDIMPNLCNIYIRV